MIKKAATPGSKGPICYLLRGSQGACSKCGRLLLPPGGAVHLPGDRHAYCGQCCPLCSGPTARKKTEKGVKAPKKGRKK